MPVTAIGAYTAQSLDRQENFNGLQLVYLCWERHLMFCAPFTLPLPPDMLFGDFIENVLKPAIASHPDAAKVDFKQAVWRLDDAAFEPELTAGLAANGIGHKSMLHLFTPGLDGLHGSFN